MAKDKPAQLATPKVGDSVLVRYLENPNAQRTAIVGKVTGAHEDAPGLLDIELERPFQRGKLRMSRIPEGDPKLSEAGPVPVWEHAPKTTAPA